MRRAAAFWPFVSGGEDWINAVKLHKGTRGMSWRQEAMKGVEDCEKPGEAVKRALIPGFLNWHTLNP